LLSFVGIYHFSTVIVMVDALFVRVRRMYFLGFYVK